MDPIESTVFTLDPGAKYLKPKPFEHIPKSTTRRIRDRLLKSVKSVETPKVVSHVTNAQIEYDDQRLGARASSFNYNTPRRPKSYRSPVKQPLFSTVQKMRGSRSAGSNAWRELCTGQRQPSLENITASSEFYAEINESASTFHVNDLPKAGLSAARIRGNTTRNIPSPVDASSSSVIKGVPSKEASASNSSYEYLASFSDMDNQNYVNSYGCCVTPTSDQLLWPRNLEGFEQNYVDHQLTLVDQADKPIIGSESPCQEESFIYQPFNDKHNAFDTSMPKESTENLASYRSRLNCHNRRQNNSISSSYKTADNFSPGLAPSTTNTDGMSPYHLPQPETPSISEFGDDNFISEYELQDAVSNVVEPDELPIHRLRLGSSATVHDAAYPSFQGYSLSKIEHESALTLTKLPSNPLSADCESPLRNQASKSLIHSWNDGSHNRMSLLEELVDDLGYLGDLII